MIYLNAQCIRNKSMSESKKNKKVKILSRIKNFKGKNLKCDSQSIQKTSYPSRAQNFGWEDCFTGTMSLPSTKSSRPGVEWKVISLLCYCQRKEKLGSMSISSTYSGKTIQKISPLYQPCWNWVNILLFINLKTLTTTNINDNIMTVSNKISDEFYIPEIYFMLMTYGFATFLAKY